MERNHRMELQYDGTGLHGWAKQDGLPTVEGCLEEAFRTVLGRGAAACAWPGAPTRACTPGARWSACSLPDGVDLLQAAPLAQRPDAARHRGAGPAAAPRRRSTRARMRPAAATATSCAPQPVVSPFWSRLLLAGARRRPGPGRHGRAAAAASPGRHHFTAFTPTETEHVFFDRTVLRCRWTRAAGGRGARPAAALAAPAGRAGAPARARGGMLCLEIEADAFLRHMVRTLVGTMVEVGRGERSLEDFAAAAGRGAARGGGPHGPAARAVPLGHQVRARARRQASRPGPAPMGKSPVRPSARPAASSTTKRQTARPE